MTTLPATCLTVTWQQDPEGCWLATSQFHPRWSYRTDPYPMGHWYSMEDKKAAETSLKRRATKSLSFAHEIPHREPAA